MKTIKLKVYYSDTYSDGHVEETTDVVTFPKPEGITGNLYEYIKNEMNKISQALEKAFRKEHLPIEKRRKVLHVEELEEI